MAVAPAVGLLNLLDGGAGFPDALLEFAAQFDPGEFPVGSLGPLALAADFDPRRSVPQPDGGTRLVDLLTTRAGAADKALVDVLHPHADGGETGCDLSW